MPDRVEWVNATELAEFAEVVGTTTDLVMSVREDDGTYAVLYTPDWPENRMVWGAVMRRDEDDVLQLVAPAEPQPGLWERMRDRLDRLVAAAKEES